MTDEAEAAIALRFSNTHLYRGARGAAAAPLPRRAAGAIPCAVEFSDGAAAFGEIAKCGPERWRLALGPHVTARGAGIGARAWVLGPDAAAEAEGVKGGALVVLERVG